MTDLFQRNFDAADLRYRDLLLRGHAPTRTLTHGDRKPEIWVLLHDGVMDRYRSFGPQDGLILFDDTLLPGSKREPLALSGFDGPLLRIHADDITAPFRHKATGVDFAIFTDAHASAVVAFYNSYATMLRRICVSCTAGVSRSRALAAALQRLRGDDDLEHFAAGQPNGHVYVTMLGIPSIADYHATLETAFKEAT